MVQVPFMNLPYNPNNGLGIRQLPYNPANPVPISPLLSLDMPTTKFDDKIMKSLEKKRKQLLNSIPDIPSFKGLMDKAAQEQAQLPTFEEVFGKLSPGSQRFHNRYNGILQQMFKEYGVRPMAPGSLANAKAAFEARKNAYETIQRAKEKQAEAQKKAQQKWQQVLIDAEERQAELNKKAKEKAKKDKAKNEDYIDSLLKEVEKASSGGKKSSKKKKKKKKKGLLENIWDDLTGLGNDIADDVKDKVSGAGKELSNIAKAIADGPGGYKLSDVAKDTSKQLKKEQKEDAKRGYSSNLSKEIHRGISRALDSATGGLISNFQDAENKTSGYHYDTSYRQDRKIGKGGITDILTSGIGLLAPTAGATKLVRGLGLGAKLAKDMTAAQKAAQLAKEGTLIGGGVEAANQVMQELTHPDEASFDDHLRNIVLGAALGAIGDPVLHGVASKVRDLRTRFREGKVSMPEAQKELVRILEDTPPNPSISKVRNVINTPDLSGVLRDVTKFKTSLPKLDVKKFNVNIAPNRQMDDIIKTIDDLQSQYKTMEASHVQKGLEPHLQREQEWNALKELDDEYKRVRNAYGGKIHIPEANRSDWADTLPRAFKAGKNYKEYADDLYAAAQQEGFNNVDQFIEYLNRLNEAHRIIKAGKSNFIGVGRGANASYKNLDDVVNELKKQFAETDTAKAIKSSLDYLKSEQEKVWKGSATATETAIRDISNAVKPRPVPKNQKLPPTARYKSLDELTPEEQQLAGQKAEGIRGRGVSNYGNKAKKADDKIDSGLRRTVNQALKRFNDSATYLKRVDKRAHMLATTARGSAGAVEYKAKTDLLPAMVKVEKAGRNLRDAWDYAYAKHFLEVMKHYERQGETYHAPLPKERLQGIVKQFEKDPVINEFVDSLRKITNDMLDFLKESGYLSDDQVKAMKKLYPNYLPKGRSKDLVSENDPNKMEQAFDFLFTGGKNPIIKLEKGSIEPVRDPIDNMIKYMHNVYYTGMRNRMIKQLATAAGKRVGKSIPVREVSPKKAGPNVIKYRVDGVEKAIEVSKDVREAIDSVRGILNTDEVTNLLHRISKIQGMSITANPVFAVKSLIRDTPGAWTVGKFNLFRDLPAAALDMITNGKLLGNRSLLKEFYERGAGQSTIAGYDRNSFYELQKMAKKLKGHENMVELGLDKTSTFFKDILDKFRAFNEFTEQLPKMAEFRAVARKTGDLDLAAFRARDIMDFQRSGTFVQSWNKYARFVNATIRGREKLIREITERPITVSLKMLVSGGIPSVLAIMAYEKLASKKQKQIIDEAPEWLTSTYWLFPSLTNKNSVIRIPKPYEVAAAVSSPIEWAYKNLTGKKIDMQKEIQNWLVNNVLIDSSLNPITPIFEFESGRDLFTGRDIVPEREQKGKKINQQDVYTASTARGIAKFFNAIGLGNTNLASPRQIQHLMEGYAPGVTENVNNIIDGILEKAGIRKNVKPTNELRNPVKNIVGQFFVSSDNQPSPEIGSIYDYQQKMYNLKKQQTQNGGVFKYPRIYSVLNKAYKQDGEFAAAIREIDNNPNLSANEKKAERDRIISERNAFVRALDRAGFFTSDPKKLDALERSLVGKVKVKSGSDRGSSTERNLIKKLVKAGVSKDQILKIMNSNLTDLDKKRAVNDLLKNK